MIFKYFKYRNDLHKGYKKFFDRSADRSIVEIKQYSFHFYCSLKNMNKNMKKISYLCSIEMFTCSFLFLIKKAKFSEKIPFSILWAAKQIYKILEKFVLTWEQSQHN